MDVSAPFKTWRALSSCRSLHVLFGNKIEAATLTEFEEWEMRMLLLLRKGLPLFRKRKQALQGGDHSEADLTIVCVLLSC